MKKWFEPLDSSAKRCFSSVGLILLAVLLFSNLIAVIYSFFLADKLSDPVNNAFSLGCLYFFGIPLGVLLFKYLPVSQFEKKHLGLSEFLIFFSISVLMVYSGSYFGMFLMSVVEKITGIHQTNIADEVIGNIPIWIELPVTVIIGPFCEEILFRKKIIDATRAYGERTAIIFSSVCFALFHGNFSQFFYAFAVGLVFGFVYMRTGRIRYSFLMHMLINFLGSYAVMWLTSGADIENIASAEAFGPESILVIVYSFFIIALCVVGFINLRNILREYSRLPAVYTSNRTVYINAGMLVFIILAFLEAVFFLLYF